MRKTDATFSYMKILKKSCRVSRNTSWFFIRRVRMESWCLFWARMATWNGWNMNVCLVNSLVFSTSCSAVSELLSRMRFSKNFRISFLFSEAEIEESIGVWPNLSLDLRAVWMKSPSLCSRHSSLNTSNFPSLQTLLWYDKNTKECLEDRERKSYLARKWMTFSSVSWL